jgi:restriction system protein
LKALKAMGGSGTNEELLNKIIELERVPSEIQAVEHTDHRQSRLGYNLAWAKTYLKKVGAIDNSRRGVWSITKDGEGLTEAEVQLVPARVRKQIAEERLRRGSPELQDNAVELVAEGELESPELHWKDKLLTVLRGLAPDAFERLAQRILREAGFIKSRSRVAVVTAVSTVLVSCGSTCSHFTCSFNANGINRASAPVLFAISAAPW